MASEGDSETPEDGGPEAEGAIQRCDYCRLPIPSDAVTREHEDVTYRYCSDACFDAVEDSDRVFTEFHGFRRFNTGVSVLDASLPQGVPRNSFVMLTDLAGTRTEALQAELVWRALQRGEPVVYVSFLEPPVSVAQEFVSLEWNVLPSLERGDLQILDCFTYRVDDRRRMYERMSTWNSHIRDVARDATTTVRDPSDMAQLQNRLDSALENVADRDHGVVVIDSLTELGSLVQPVQAYRFLKDVRADVCKGRFVPVFAGATVTGDGEAFPHDMGYIVDGLIEMRLNEDLVEGALVKQLRVRKMSGVLTFPEWEVYEYTAGEGIVTFDPVAQMEAAREDGNGESESTEKSDGDATDGE
ncbi:MULTISPECIES: ATPase domain-containing protein [Salinibaculum]|uniref:ATPase domain-containing protein n=1 Tax=Salinibaculum TaxID=2732368 RepID=UPI0030D4A022